MPEQKFTSIFGILNPRMQERRRPICNILGVATYVYLNGKRFSFDKIQESTTLNIKTTALLKTPKIWWFLCLKISNRFPTSITYALNSQHVSQSPPKCSHYYPNYLELKSILFSSCIIWLHLTSLLPPQTYTLLT